MREFLTDFYIVNRGGGHGGVLSVTQGNESYIAILIDKGLTRDEIFLTPTDARDLINALRRELQEGVTAMRDKQQQQLLTIHQPIVDRDGDQILVTEGIHNALISISDKRRVKAVVILDADAVKNLVADLSNFLRGTGDA